jgi:hypothetical protein
MGMLRAMISGAMELRAILVKMAIWFWFCLIGIAALFGAG